MPIYASAYSLTVAFAGLHHCLYHKSGNLKAYLLAAAKLQYSDNAQSFIIKVATDSLGFLNLLLNLKHETISEAVGLY